MDDQRVADEASIREVAQICVEQLSKLPALHQSYTLSLINAELGLRDYLDNEASNRASSIPLKV